MILLLDSCQKHDEIAPKESGMECGHLMTPGTYRNYRGGVFGIDNGAFGTFDAPTFERLLKKHEPHKQFCKFVAAPDVVGSARRTLEVFDFWYPKLHGWPVALVAQDGQENLPINWKVIDAIFIGGSTAFKTSQGAAQIIKTAKILEKWVHVGRVNDPWRSDWCEKLGVDSVDGTGISQHSWQRKNLKAGLPLLDEMEKSE